MEDFPQQNVQQTHSKFRIEQKKLEVPNYPHLSSIKCNDEQELRYEIRQIYISFLRTCF